MEIEAKYAIGDPGTFERLRQGEPAGRYKFVFLSEHDASDVYLDTAGRHLMQAGWVLRVREGVQPGRAAVTLKSRGRSRGAIHRREELEMIVPAGTAPADWPVSALVRKVQELTEGAPLLEALRLRQHRVLHDVRRAKRTVAVRFLDQVVFEAGARAHTSLEMEVELTGAGSLEDLHALDGLLRADHVQPQAQSKFERALEWAGALDREPGTKPRRAAAAVAGETPPAQAAPVKAKPPQVAPQDEMVEAGRRVLAFHAQRMLAHEPGVRAGDADALHDMRVAVRRQRSLLRILSPWLRRKTVRQFRARLRDAGTALGQVRDFDVLIQAGEAYAAGHRRGRAAALQPLLVAWAEERASARKALLACLEDAAWPKFCVRYAEFLENPGAAIAVAAARPRGEASCTPARVAELLPAAIWSQYGVLRAYQDGVETAPFETLHRIRIETKRLRYLLEFFKPALDPGIDTAIHALVAVQDHLGALNDAHVAAARVRSFLEASAATGQMRALIAARAYLEYLIAECDRRRTGFEPLWSGITGLEFRRSLAQACAAL